MFSDPVMNQLEAVKKTSQSKVEYWMARAIQPILGYASWDKFTNVIRKAMMSCESAGVEPKDHFSRTGNMVEIGSGARREEEDYFLSRYACYLVAMNGDTTKVEVAAAQTYFAVQTRRQEIRDSRGRLDYLQVVCVEQWNHWGEPERLASVANADSLGRLSRSVLLSGGSERP